MNRNAYVQIWYIGISTEALVILNNIYTSGQRFVERFSYSMACALSILHFDYSASHGDVFDHDVAVSDGDDDDASGVGENSPEYDQR